MRFFKRTLIPASVRAHQKIWADSSFAAKGLGFAKLSGQPLIAVGLWRWSISGYN